MRNMTVAGPMFVATNLSGVYAKVRRPDIAAGPFNIGSLFNPNFLSRLLALIRPLLAPFVKRFFRGIGFRRIKSHPCSCHRSGLRIY